MKHHYTIIGLISSLAFLHCGDDDASSPMLDSGASDGSVQQDAGDSIDSGIASIADAGYEADSGSLICQNYAFPLSPGEVPPAISDPSAAPTPSPLPTDPFGTALEVDNQVPLPGGAPTTPKNLRVELVSNNWAEINWAPSNDDESVAAYRVHRSDGHVYTILRDQVAASGGAQAEVDKYFQTTSFVDCNFTRFAGEIHDCDGFQPNPGDVFSYEVVAVDGEGNESPRSNSVTIRYHEASAAEVPRYADFYLDGDDDFAQCNDLSQTQFFINEFDLMFSDEFDQSIIDDTKWNTRLTWGDGFIINGEQQYFVDTQTGNVPGYDPFTLTGDSLVIEAVPMPQSMVGSLPESCRAADPTGNARCSFLSGALSSFDKFGFTYGYVEGRMKVSETPGALSSFYLFNRYPGSGIMDHAPEIDIVEYLGENPFGSEDAFQTYHYNDPIYDLDHSSPTMGEATGSQMTYADDFHTFGVLWEPQLVIWYIDGQEIKRLSGPQVSRQQMNIVTYLVAGSDWAPTPDVSNPALFPLRLEVDYIKAYQRRGYRNNASFAP